MKNITINIPEFYDEKFDELIEQGVIPSRSEGVRAALRQYLYNEYKRLETIGYFEYDPQETIDTIKKGRVKREIIKHDEVEEHG